MPLYTYDCTAYGCIESFLAQDRLVRVDDRDQQKCHRCGSPLKRRISAADYRMKGRTRNVNPNKGWPIEKIMESEGGGLTSG